MTLPEGLLFVPEFVSVEEEAGLIAFVRDLDFHEFQMRGVTARRRVASFGWHYSFESYKATPADPIPEPLLPLRARAAAVAGIAPEAFSEALATEYQPGAGIGWHRDAPPFGIVAGISLGAACRMRFQKGKGAERAVAAVELTPRSLYVLTGEARTKWEHTIPAVKGLRYSVTFRTMRREQPPDTRTDLV
jgi:alkylated DNA repair dioxygenase AlkB